MLFKLSQKPLTACDILHSLPGRIRINSRAVGYLNDFKEEIEARLTSDFAVISAGMSPVTENILVHFDTEKTNAREILELTETVIGSYSMKAFQQDRETKNKQTVQERRLQEEPISEMLIRIAINGMTLLYSLIRKPAPPTTLFKKFTNINALTAISLSRPIFTSGLNALRFHRRPNADTLSSAAILASLLSGKSGSSLTIILLADIAELITAYTMEKTRSAIVDMLSLEKPL
jgi:cation-transporting P-type ATPase C